MDQSDQAAAGEKKDAAYIARLALPIIAKLEATKDQFDRNLNGVVDMVAFDGAKNVQNAGMIIATHHPQVTVVHGAEHVASLFFKDVFEHVVEYQLIGKLNKKIRNVFGSTRHATTAMFREESKNHFGNRAIGFIKPSECRLVFHPVSCFVPPPLKLFHLSFFYRMAGEQIALLRLNRLVGPLKSTVTTKKFQDLKSFRAYFFSVCHLLLDGPKFTTTGEFGGELLHVNRNHVGTYLIMQNKKNRKKTNLV